MITDTHIHILPGIDDGSSSSEMSLEMLEILKEQGVGEIFATPHFYAHRERSVEDFLAKRQAAYEKIGSPANMRLGAEISVEHGISKMDGIEELAIQGTDLILLEFPYSGYSSWMEEEIYNISVIFKLKPVVAHIHRYIDIFSKAQMESVLKMNAGFQVNNEAFGNFRQRKFVKDLIKNGYPLVFGSDSHNLSDRKPNWDVLCKKVKPNVLDGAAELLRLHMR